MTGQALGGWTQKHDMDKEESMATGEAFHAVSTPSGTVAEQETIPVPSALLALTTALCSRGVGIPTRTGNIDQVA